MQHFECSLAYLAKHRNHLNGVSEPLMLVISLSPNVSRRKALYPDSLTGIKAPSDRDNFKVWAYWEMSSAASVLICSFAISISFRSVKIMRVRWSVQDQENKLRSLYDTSCVQTKVKLFSFFMWITSVWWWDHFWLLSGSSWPSHNSQMSLSWKL